MTAMGITIHSTFLPHTDPDASLVFYRDTLGFEVRNDVGYDGMRWITVGPADQPGTSIVLHPPASPAPSGGCRPAAPRSFRNRPSSHTAFATAPSATPRATCSASTSCAE